MSSSPSMSEPIDGRVIWQAFSCRLRAFIVRRVAVSADVDDILQSVFLNMQRHREALGHGDRVEAWLYRTTRNAIVDHYRARGREPSPMGDDPHDLPEVLDEASSGTSVGAEIARCLAPMLERLPARYQEILALTDLGGATMVQASERLGLSVSGAKTRAQRGRALLKKQVLSCCRVDLDARGSVIGYERQSGACGGCGPATPSTKGGCSD